MSAKLRHPLTATGECDVVGPDEFTVRNNLPSHVLYSCKSSGYSSGSSLVVGVLETLFCIQQGLAIIQLAEDRWKETIDPDEHEDG